MRAPKTFAGRLLTGAAVVAAGASAGALAGWQVQKVNGQLAQSTGAALGGAFGGLVTSYAALVFGAREKSRWRGVGEAAAIVGFGGVTAMAAATALGPNGVFAGLIPQLVGGPAAPAVTGPATTQPPTGSTVPDAGGGGGSF
jgi:hypothetical protein